MNATKHIAMFSGGKDSTQMVLELIRRNYPLDYIVFADFGAEWPQMYAHIAQVEAYIGREILKLQHPRGNFWYFFKEHLKLRGNNPGRQRGYGWCGKLRWGTGEKKTILNKFTATLKKQGFDIVEYHGVSMEEENRLGKNNDGRQILYPLVDWRMTGNDNLNACYRAGFAWGGLYQHLDRVSCWCCENKNLKELKIMYHLYPEMWKQLEELQRQTPFLFKGKGVFYYSDRFASDRKKDLFGGITSAWSRTFARPPRLSVMSTSA